MRTNKIVLCIDWSNICFRSLFINQVYGSGQSSTFNNIEDCRSFIHKFATDVCSIINIFKPNNVVILADSKNAWRKSVLDTYKSNRQKSPNINWDNIYRCADDLKEIFRKAGCHIAETVRAEADDMAAMCKECVFEQYPDSNIIIVSADADLRQLIQFNKETTQYCIVYNTTTKGATGKRYMYVPQEFIDWYESPSKVDIFYGTNDVCKQYVKNIMQMNQKIAFEVNDPNEILLGKIFCGDDGDCVPSFYTWASNGKFVRITKSKEKKIREKLEINDIHSLVESAKTSEFKEVLDGICKKDVNDVDFNERVHFQRTLVELNSELFPPEIREFKENVSYMVGDFKEGTFNNFKASDLLANTEYANADKKKAIEADVFKDMKKYGLF